MSLLAAAFVLAQASASASASITVTATRTETRVADTPASVVVVSKENLDATAAPTLDDALRQVAGFTLFRRTGSRVANPTSQGVSLRGVGASGASRALVLDDGVPLNDPFGGWVYWGRVPRAAVERAEVLRGGASDLYGSSAMGGVVQFIRRASPALAIDASAGSERTATTSLFAARQAGAWLASLDADLLTTAGYVLVPAEQRGAVDVDAGARHTSLDGALRRDGLFARASYYRESRNNGTPRQTNDTTIRQLAGGDDFAAFGGTLALRAYGSDQDYFQTFSAIANDRNSERLTIDQSVPSRGAGATAQWTRGFANRHVVVAGTEVRYAEGTSDELRFAANGTTTRVAAGGTQRIAAAYLEDVFALSPALTLTAGARTDWWRNEGTGGRLTEGQFNPRATLLWRANDALALSASAYTAFRAPTLNELYRGFRVGNVVTLPNASLQSEDVTGFELGARARNLRLTIFSMTVSHAIANVTLSEAAGTITRQRQNLGTTRSNGAELDGDWRFGDNWRASLGYLFVDASVRDGALRGNRVPQVARNQATAQLGWRHLALQARWSGAQFDDDFNVLPLDSYLVADLLASHPLARGVELAFAIENVTNARVEASATPVVTLGQPRAWRIGIRYGS